MNDQLKLIGRAADVGALLVKFGFGQFLEQSGLAERISFGKRPAEDAISSEPLPVRVRLLCEALGPTFVKTGQILSTRGDLVPEAWAVELQKLQNQVPAVPWAGDDGISKMLERDYGERLNEVFGAIDEEAFAAGSMAQVHRARLASGKQVVCKILRPGIRATVKSDLEIMRMLGNWSERWFESRLGFDVDSVIDEFARQLKRETDLTIEAQSTQRMKEDFADHEQIDFPNIHSDVSTRSVLVMDEVKGSLLAGLDPTTLADDRRVELVAAGVEMVCRQTLELGFFHADPHPGNIFLVPGQGLCFIDCGMTGVIDPGTVRRLARLVHSVLERDLDTVLHVAVRLADAGPAQVDDPTLRSEAWQFLEGLDVESLSELRIGELLGDFFSLMRRHDLRCPPNIIYLIKALTTIEGVAEKFAPGFDVVSHVRPYVERILRREHDPLRLAQRAKKTAQAYGDLVEELPRQIDDFLYAARKRELSLKLEHAGLEDLTTEIERASMNISWSLGLASIVIGSSILILADNMDGNRSDLSAVATIALVIAFLAGLWRLVTSRSTRRSSTK